MKQYKDLLQRILDEGESSGDRTGTGTTRIFSHSMHFDLAQGFPLVTTKFTSFRLIARELLWFISGRTNINYLVNNGVHIWDEWADRSNNLGPVYGAQWRNANGTYRKKMRDEWVQDGVDQLGNAIELIKHNPSSRRIIVDSWQVKDLPDEQISPQENVGLGLMALAPCHMMFQFFVSEDNKLSLQIYQRSVDVFLGLPFNIASYAALLHMVSHVTNKEVGTLHWVGGDIHLYNNHKDQVNELLSREPMYLPDLKISGSHNSIDDIEFNDFMLNNYNYHPAIRAPISV